MLKGFSNLITTKINKKELILNNPDALKEFEAEGQRFYILKEEWLEVFKNILKDRILERAYKNKYYLYSEIAFRETADYLYAVALVHPRFIGSLKRILKLPDIKPEEFKKMVIKKLNEYEFKPVIVEEFKEIKNAKQNGIIR